MHRADDPVAHDVHPEVAVLGLVAFDEFLEERLPVADSGVDRVAQVDLPRPAAVSTDGGLVDADVAEAFATPVQPVVREREQRVRDLDVPVGERRRGRELVDRGERRARPI